MPKRLVQHLGDRRQAVGGAGGVGHHVVLVVLVGRVVDAVADRQVGALGRCRDDHLLGAAGQVQPPPCRVEVKRPLHSRTMLTPRSFHGSLAGSRSLSTRMRLPSTTSASFSAVTPCGEAAVHGVVLEQMRQRLGVGDVVDGDELDVALADAGAQDVATDASKAIDPNLDAHGALLDSEKNVRKPLSPQGSQGDGAATR